MITQDRLKHLLDYNSDNGLFYWKVQKGSSAPGSLAGTINKNGRYITICIDRRSYYAHRLAFLYASGRFPLYTVDHINGNKLDNAMLNLRDVPQSENNKNARKRYNNSSGHSGVAWSKPQKKWYAQIGGEKNRKFLGLFSELSEAIAVRKAAEIEYGYHKNHGS